MMGDFLSNLLLRSGADPSTAASLRPRLPSLFEPPNSPDKIPAPAPDPSVRASSSPLIEPDSTGLPQPDRRGSSSTISAEHRLSPIAKESQSSIAFPDESRPSERENRSSFTPDVRVKRPVTLPEAPEDVRDASFHSGDAGIEARKTLQAKLLPVHVQKAEEMPLPKQTMRSSFETSVRLMQEDDLANENRVNPVLETSKSGLNPAAPLRTVIVAARRAERQQFEPRHEEEQQRVVEIHIGRIEVRATPAPATQPIKPRSPNVMSLDEYLQRRATGDRR